MVRLARYRDMFTGSREQLTPVGRDPLSLLPVAFVAAQLLVAPRRARALATETVAAYTVGEDAIARLDRGGDEVGIR